MRPSFSSLSSLHTAQTGAKRYRSSYLAFLALALLAGILLLAGKPWQSPAPALFPADAAAVVSPQVVTIDYNEVLADGPHYYGTNLWWTDPDQPLWRERISGLSLNAVRLAVPHAVLEPVNDNDDPSSIRWDGFLFDTSFPVTADRTLTYSKMFADLRDQGVTIIVHFPYLAPWLSRNTVHSAGLTPDIKLGTNQPLLMAAYPPKDLDEYQEFIEATLIFLVDQVGIPPERLLLEVTNEPDLPCGADPAVACFWQDWTMPDIAAVVRTTAAAVENAAPGVKLVGLSECCGTSLARELLDRYPEGRYLDALSFHYYDSSSTINLSPALDRSRELSNYKLPIFIDEYGSLTHLSEGAAGALWHSQALATFWEEGIQPLQYPISEWVHLGEPYTSMGLFQDWEANWAYKPSYFVYANFYRHFQNSQIVAHTFPIGLSGTAGRYGNGSGGAAVWITNSTSTPQEIRVEVSGYSGEEFFISVYDNLRSMNPTGYIHLTGPTPVFTFTVPARSSYSFVLFRVAGRTYLPMLSFQSSIPAPEAP